MLLARLLLEWYHLKRFNALWADNFFSLHLVRGPEDETVGRMLADFAES